MAVDDPVVAIPLGSGSDSGEVGPGNGFAEQLAPDFLGPGHFRQVFGFDFFAGPGHQRRAGHPEADGEKALGHQVLGFFLVPDYALDGGGILAAIVLGPV